MEKKTKKLQLRKETIAVLNGERMIRVVGGNSDYQKTTIWFECPADLVYNPIIDQCDYPENIDSGIRLTIKKSCNYTNCDCWSVDDNCPSIPLTNCRY